MIDIICLAEYAIHKYVKEYDAKLQGLSIQLYFPEGRIEEVAKFGREWVILTSTEKFVGSMVKKEIIEIVAPIQSNQQMLDFRLAKNTRSFMR